MNKSEFQFYSCYRSNEVILLYDMNFGYVFRAKGTGKAIPLQSLTGPEGSRRLRPPDLKTIGT
jgi:hypothetical protein